MQYLLKKKSNNFEKGCTPKHPVVGRRKGVGFGVGTPVWGEKNGILEKTSKPSATGNLKIQRKAVI